MQRPFTPSHLTCGTAQQAATAASSAGRGLRARAVSTARPIRSQRQLFTVPLRLECVLRWRGATNGKNSPSPSPSPSLPDSPSPRASTRLAAEIPKLFPSSATPGRADAARRPRTAQVQVRRGLCERDSGLPGRLHGEGCAGETMAVAADHAPGRLRKRDGLVGLGSSAG
ncbi:hypothetical protein AcV7_008485 [Taiwanofungus camphoratus]|nr:hypothetical protein AcV7_008485 [Antrodia cinnamomea]